MSGDRLPPAPSSAGPNRVIYVSRHDPDYAQSQERALKSSMSPGVSLTPIFTGSTIHMPPTTPSNKTEMSLAPTIMGHRPSTGPSRPLTADVSKHLMLESSSSLPSLLPQQPQRNMAGGVSPYAEDLAQKREVGMLRKRIKELEAENRRSAHALAKHRQLQQMKTAYGQNSSPFGGGGEGGEGGGNGMPGMISKREHEEAMAALKQKYEMKIQGLNKQHAIELNQLNAKGRTREEEEAARAAREKEERIELLRRQIGRRMMNQGLSKGWTAWSDMYKAKKYALQRLRECANRIRKPELSQAFGIWQRVWEDVMRKKELDELAKKEQGLHMDRDQLEEEVRRLNALLESADADKQRALDRLRIELAGSGEELMALQEQKAKEERVELLRRQIGRRMMNKDIATAWSAWYELWSAKTYAMERLREVGNKFRAPELSNAFYYWHTDALDVKRQMEVEALEAANRTIEGQLRQARARAGQVDLEKVALQDALTATQAALAAKEAEAKDKGISPAVVEALKKEVAQLQELNVQAENEAIEATTKREEAEADSERRHKEDKKTLEKLLAEQRRQFEDALERQRLEVEAEKEQKAKEERIELLKRQVTRRMMNRGLTRGWTAWYDYVTAKAYALNKLREVGNHLRAPELAKTFAWLARYAEARRAAGKANEAKRKVQLLSGSSERAMQLEAELEAARSELEAVKEERSALREQVSKLDGGFAEAQRLQEEQLAKEKEERVELLRRQIGRRMMNQGIANGWSAWFDFWSAKTYAMARLREVGNKFRAPELSNAFYFWIRFADAYKAAKLEREFQSKALMLAGQSEKVTELEGEITKLRKELEAVVAERSSLRDKVTSLDGGVAEAQRLREETESKAREERIELLRRQVTRRIMNKDISLGWTAWYDFWAAKTYAMTRLREVGNRFRSPELSVCFTSWLTYTDLVHQAKQMAELRKQAGGLENERSAIREEMESLKSMYESKLAAAEEEKRVALERQLIELTGSQEAQAALIEQQAKEERIELLRRQIGRRIMNQGITKAWTAWTDMWAAKTYAMERLRQCGNRLRSPDLMIAFEQWQWTIEEEARVRRELAAQALASQLEDEKDRLNGEVARVRAEYEEKLRKAEEVKVMLLEKVKALGGGSAEAAELLEAQSALEKEKRIELLRRQIARRMLNQGIVRGWQAWTEAYYAKKNALHMLRLVGNRFRAPAVAEAWELWVGMIEAKKEREEERKRKERERLKREGLQAEAGSLEEQLEDLRMEMRRKLEAAETEKQIALQRQLTELTGSAEEISALQEQKAKEERVELLRRQVTRRMMNKGIANAWNAWFELWDAKTYAMARLREVGNKFRAPELSNAFGFWAESVLEERRRAEREALEKASKSLEATLRRTRHEKGQIELVRVAQEDELKALREKVNEMREMGRIREKDLEKAIEEGKELPELKALHAVVVEAKEGMEKRIADAEEDAIKQRQSDRELLERLLAEQRKQFEDEYAESRTKVKTLTAQRNEAEGDRGRLTGELAMAKAEIEKMIGTYTTEIDKLKKEIAKLKAPKPKPKPAPVKTSAVGKIDLDESEGAPPISEQLGEALKKNSARVLDLFRNWDADGDGEVSRAEFHKAMPALGLEVPKAEIDKLFDEWDKGGDGALGLRELQKILKAPPAPKQKVQAAATSAKAAMTMLKLAKAPGFAPIAAPPAMPNVSSPDAKRPSSRGSSKDEGKKSPKSPAT